MLEEIEGRRRRVHLRSWPATLEAEQAPLVAQAAGVREQVADGDALAEVGYLGEVFPDVVVERQLAVLRQQDERRRGELFGDRTALEHRLLGDRRAILEVGHAIAVRVERLAILGETDRAAGSSLSEA